MEIEIDDGSLRKKLDALKDGLPGSSRRGGEAGTRVLAEKLAERVRELIPDKGGWYDVYRSGVQLIEITPGTYEVSTKFTRLGFDQIEAATTLLWFSGGDDVSRLLSADNPWTVDTIPSIVGGFSSDIIVKPGSESEVDFHRRKQLANAGTTKLMLERLGKRMDPNGLPNVNGRVLADVPFLARRLEFGLGGFPRTQIWGRLPSESRGLDGNDDVDSAASDAFDEEIKKHLG